MSENMEEARTGADNTVVRKEGKVYLKFRGNLYPAVEKERSVTEGRYIVYPEGVESWSELKETLELLKSEGVSPAIVKYKGLWNVEAGAAKREKTFLIGWKKCLDCGATLTDGKDPDGFFHTSCNYRIWLEEEVSK